MTYKCKSCGWEKSIPALWSDVKPRFCANAKCELSLKKGKGKKSFRSNPEQLEAIMPAPKPAPEASKPAKKGPKVKKKK